MVNQANEGVATDKPTITTHELNEMSDSDFASINLDNYNIEEGHNQNAENVQSDDNEVEESTEEFDDEDGSGDSGDYTLTDSDDDINEDSSDVSDSDSDEFSDDEEGDPSEETESEETESEEVNYKGMMEELMASFDANGVEFKVRDVEEARKLMRQGAHYGKKLQAMAPHTKLLQTLQKEGIGLENINFLIDLNNKKPAAINKLIKESGIDPLDFDTEEDAEYQAKDYLVSDEVIAVNNVLDNLESTPTFNKLIDVVKNQWDAASRAEMTKQPVALEWINSHIANGVFDAINAEVTRERLLGNLGNISDLEAYQRVGDALNARGDLNKFYAPKASKKLPPKSNANEDPKIEAKKRAAKSTFKKSSGRKPNLKDFDPLVNDMSDDEFMQNIGSKIP